MKSVISVLLGVFLFFLNSSMILAGPPPNPSMSFGRDELYAGEVLAIIGIVIIYLVMKYLMSSAWDAQDKNDKDDRP